MKSLFQIPTDEYFKEPPPFKTAARLTPYRIEGLYWHLKYITVVAEWVEIVVV